MPRTPRSGPLYHSGLKFRFCSECQARQLIVNECLQLAQFVIQELVVQCQSPNEKWHRRSYCNAEAPIWVCRRIRRVSWVRLKSMLFGVVVCTIVAFSWFLHHVAWFSTTSSFGAEVITKVASERMYTPFYVLSILNHILNFTDGYNIFSWFQRQNVNPWKFWSAFFSNHSLCSCGLWADISLGTQKFVRIFRFNSTSCWPLTAFLASNLFVRTTCKRSSGYCISERISFCEWRACTVRRE